MYFAEFCRHLKTNMWYNQGFLKIFLKITKFSNISGKNSFYRMAGMQRHSTDFAE